jgi:hypothetical protein
MASPQRAEAIRRSTHPADERHRQEAARPVRSRTDTRAVIKLGQTDTIGGTLRSGAKPLAAQIVLREKLVRVT